ncbi:hypothetical protein FSP39_019543 [Pinctada imbricata]|uniref:Tyr recombinase domain-containing protein n=1 Tax=Pinctada imbricata TaxID=66713 RepID=A0AA88Y0V6_PINIB|nr:hypothetical protein FSP39_019543 [Pinctada imbricata]
MDAETKRLIQVEIQNTITDSQNTMMTEIKNLITSEMSSMQRQNQAIADKQLSKIEESLTDTYKFKKRGNEEQFKHNTKVLSKLPGTCAIIFCARSSENTCKSYSNGFKKWQRFISAQGHSALPAHPVHIALYLTHLLDSGASSNTVNLAVYCIKWVHGLNGYSDPTDNSFVKNLQESAKRRAKPKTCRKDPVTPEMLIKLCEMFKSSSDLLVVRDLTMILLSFAGFLRYDEISSLCCQDVKIFDGYFSIKITKSKTDQYRHGDEILIAEGSTIACPLKMLQRYLRLAKINISSDHFLFKQVYRSKKTCALIHKNKKISYTAAKANMVSKLKLVGGSADFGLHSMRSGGATQAANASLSVGDRCLKRHGRWKTDSSKDRYIADSVEKRLEVSKRLGI